MTTYGPYKRLTINTPDAIITITGSNMIATVTGCDGGAPSQGYSFVDVNSSETSGRMERHESGASDDDESSSAVAQQPLVSRDMESVSHTSRILGRSLPISTVTHETTTTSDSIKPNNIDSATDRCGSPNDIRSDAPISSGSDYNSESEGGNQLCDSSPELSIGNKRKHSDDCNTDEKEESLVIRKSICSSIGQVGNDVGIITDSNSLDSELQSQNAKKKKAAKICLHTGKRLYSCDTCGKTLIRSDSLAHHVRLHTGERPYSCDTCCKTFISSGQLTSHTRTHTGERPYSCDICGKSFKQKGHVTTHLRTHTGEKPYSCDTCGKAFAVSGSLTRHIRIHM